MEVPKNYCCAIEFSKPPSFKPLRPLPKDTVPSNLLWWSISIFLLTYYVPAVIVAMAISHRLTRLNALLVVGIAIAVLALIMLIRLGNAQRHGPWRLIRAYEEVAKKRQNRGVV
jgi:hypothetical protein